MLTKIISGGQTGVDRLALEVAKSLGYETGGTAPKGWLTEKGPDLTLKEFGLIEGDTEIYTERTIRNVLDSDGTVLFGNMESPGSRKTLTTLKDTRPYICNPSVEQFIDFIQQNDITTLNIAGNRGSRLSEENRLKYKNIITKALEIIKVSHMGMRILMEGLDDERNFIGED